VLGLVPRTAIERTQRGESWASDAHERLWALRTAPPERVRAELLAAGGLVLLLEHEVLPGLDAALRALRAEAGVRAPDGVALGSSTGDDEREDPVGALDVCPDLAGLAALDPAFDAASAADGGGDGGGD
jgi:hypothetical protein